MSTEERSRPQDHDTRLHYFGTLPFGWCPCGWEGPTRGTMQDAADDARAHEREVTG